MLLNICVGFWNKQGRHLLKDLESWWLQKPASSVWTPSTAGAPFLGHSVSSEKAVQLLSARGTVPEQAPESSSSISPASQSPWALGARSRVYEWGRMCCRKMVFSEPPGNDPSWQHLRYNSTDRLRAWERPLTRALSVTASLFTCFPRLWR